MEKNQQQQRAILIHYGELGLKKGIHRANFSGQLRANIQRKLRALELNWTVLQYNDYFSVPIPPETPESQLDSVLLALQKVFGIAWIAVARRVEHGHFVPDSQAQDFGELEEILLETANARYVQGQAFAVRVHRSDKSLPFTSPELEARLGATIRERSPWQSVRLTDPDVTFHVELHKDETFLFSTKIKGAGGLPVGSSGRVLVLLSGGIDSPVAAWLMAKRGCNVDFIHFAATSMQQEEALQYKVWHLVRTLGEYTMRSRLFLVPYTHFDIALTQQNVGYELILFRRFMARVAERLAHQLGAQALVTGDSLSQVASQTLSNIVSTSKATEMPVFRPLIGLDKQDIMDLAARIGTYDLSIQPYKDCCALVGRHPSVSSDHDELSRKEASVFPDYEKLIGQTLAEAVCMESGSSAIRAMMNIE